MRCYDHLYMGKKAGKRRFPILQGLREGKLLPEVYVITPPQNGNNILDIYPSVMLHLPPYCDQDLMIVGVAVTYWEALDVVRQIVDDLYHQTGGFSVEDLWQEKTAGCRENKECDKV